MNNVNAVPLLLLLLLMIYRNSSANPVDQEDDPIIKGMKAGAQRYITMFESLVDFNKDTSFEDNLLMLKDSILSLPGDLDIDTAKVVELLVNTQDRIHVIRTFLTTAANTLKILCNVLLEIYIDNEDDLSVELVKYSAEEFIAHSNIVLPLLEKAHTEYRTIQIGLASAVGKLEVVKKYLGEKDVEITKLQDKQNKLKNKAKELKKRADDIRKEQEKNRDIAGEIGGCVLGVFFTLGAGCGIAAGATEISYKVEADDTRDKIHAYENALKGVETKIDESIKSLTEVKGIVKTVQKSSVESINHVYQMIAYFRGEIGLIVEWKAILDLEIARSKHLKITADKLKFGIKAMKRSLNDLITACDIYLAHTLPGGG